MHDHVSHIEDREHHEDHCLACENEHGHVHEYREDELSLKTILPIAAGTIFFIISFFTDGLMKIVLLGAAYLLIGLPVLIEAVSGLIHGHPFDEQVLMGIATVGAICIGEYTEAVSVMLFYRIGEWLQDLAVDRSRDRIGDAVSLHPDKVRVLRDGKEEAVAPDEVSPGERFVTGVGERIALDGVIIRGESRLDCSSLTGESATVAVGVGDEVLAGTMNTVSSLEIEVLRGSEDSATGRLLHSIEEASENKPALERFITRFSRIYTPCVVVAAVMLALIPILLNQNASTWVHRALMFLVISCPCALVLSIPLTFFAGLGLMSKHGVLFKGADRMEAMGKIRAVVLDKTGTLTDGQFTVLNVETDGMDREELLRYSAAVEMESPHPVADAIRKTVKDPYIAENLKEHAGKGVSGTVDGKEVLVGNSRLFEEYSVERKDFPGILVSVDGVCRGGIEVGENVRASAALAVDEWNREVGYTALLTGDRMEPAMKVAEELGISEVHAHLMPEDKLTVLERIRNEHGSVLFLGDGINDAPVLAGADVGVAMAEHGTEMAAEAADALLLTGNLLDLSFAYRGSKYTARIAKQNIVLALVIKAAALFLAAIGVVTGMWVAVVADVGAALLCVFNALRVFAYRK